MALAGLLILMGLSVWDEEALIPDLVLALAVLATAIDLATRRDDRPLRRSTRSPSPSPRSPARSTPPWRWSPRSSRSPRRAC
jgi:hypothetical protein